MPVLFIQHKTLPTRIFGIGALTTPLKMILVGLQKEHTQCTQFLVEKLRPPKQEHRLDDSIIPVPEPSAVVPPTQW